MLFRQLIKNLIRILIKHYGYRLLKTECETIILKNLI